MTDDKEIKIALVGKSGNGKSSSGNTILFEKGKKRYFTTSSEEGSCTTYNKCITRKLRGRNVTVIDTPGTQHTDMHIDDVTREIYNIVEATEEGIDVFLITFKFTSDGLNEDERRSLNVLERAYSDKPTFFDHVIFLFTFGDEFENYQSRQKKVHEQPLKFEEEICKDLYSVKKEAVGPIVGKANNRMILFNNVEDDKKRIAMSERLMKMVDKLIKRDGYERYTRKDLPAEINLPPEQPKEINLPPEPPKDINLPPEQPKEINLPPEQPKEINLRPEQPKYTNLPPEQPKKIHNRSTGKKWWNPLTWKHK